MKSSGPSRKKNASNRVVCGSKKVSKKKQIHEDARTMHRPKFLIKSSAKWERRPLGGHDLVRRIDRQGEVLIWCRKSSGYARQRKGPKTEFKLWKTVKSQPRRQKIGGSKDKRKESWDLGKHTFEGIENAEAKTPSDLASTRTTQSCAQEKTRLRA